MNQASRDVRSIQQLTPFVAALTEDQTRDFVNAEVDYRLAINL